MDLPKLFKIYLKTRGVSKVTIKNYISDLTHFLAWMELFLRSQNLPLFQNESEFLGRYFTQNLVERYKNYLFSNLPLSTVNRRLSTLRTFARFCLRQAWITEDPTKNISNIATERQSTRATKEKILEEFRKSLEKEKTSSNTIKNYLSDIRGFLIFVETAT